MLIALLELVLKVRVDNVAEPMNVDPDSGLGSGWGLSGSTNSYSASYTIRATENANSFSVI